MNRSGTDAGQGGSAVPVMGGSRMLVLTRKKNESIVVNGPCRIVVVEIRGDTVRLGFEAEREVEIYREEIARQREENNT